MKNIREAYFMKKRCGFYFCVIVILVAATMVLQYYVVPITAEEFAGNPFSEYAYGCFAPPIVEAINGNSTMCNAQIIANKSLE